MEQFLTARDVDFDGLIDRARNSCIVFPDQRMPPGVHPTRARVGVEHRTNPQILRLLVDRGLRYEGANAEIRTWVTQGGKDFSTVDAMRNWVRGPLAQAFQPGGSPATPLAAPQAVPPTAGSPARPARPVEGLTDWAAVDLPSPPSAPDAEAITRVLTERIRGQDAALGLIAAATVRHVAKTTPRRPLSLLMVGPPGVGKTLAMETLARALGESIDGFGYLRIDMAEYQEPHRVAQLLGAPPGYLGHGQGSELTDRLASSPTSLILFDEVEKAHPGIFLMLMSAMDAGRLTLPAGANGQHRLDCSRAIFGFTSNLRSGPILATLEERRLAADAAAADTCIRQELLKANLLPELVDRITHCVAFRPLDVRARLEALALNVVMVGREYGLDLRHIAPSALSALTRQQDQRSSIRAQVFLIERALGDVFGQAASHLGPAAVALEGPPFRCIPIPTGSGIPASLLGPDPDHCPPRCPPVRAGS